MNKLDRILRPEETKESVVQSLIIILEGMQLSLEKLNSRVKELEEKNSGHGLV